MLLLAKIAGVAVLVWFYLAAQQHKEPPVKWAVIGLVGYVLSWLLVYETLMVFAVTKGFVMMQIPVFCAVAATYLIRKKLIHDAIKSQEVTQPKVE